METMLKSIYYDPSHPASFGSIRRLYIAAKKIDPKITTHIVKTWLQGQDVYTLHGRQRHRFARRKTLSPGLYYQMQMDLVDLSNIKSKNKNYRYLLTAIDIFNRRAFAIPLFKKKSSEIVRALKTIFAQYPTVKYIHTDQGSEFFNKEVKQYCKENGMKLFYTSSDTKASMVERFNRTLKDRMFKYFSANNTLSYIPVLDDLVEAYNNTRHRSIGISPNAVTKQNEQEVWNYQYRDYLGKYGKTSYVFELEDTVRISKLREQFRKGYLPTYQEEYFKIHDRMLTHPPAYKLRDMNGEVLQGIFYREELQKVIPQKKQYKILRSRKRKGIREHLVHFIGYPSNLDNWVKQKDLNNETI